MYEIKKNKKGYWFISRTSWQDLIELHKLGYKIIKKAIKKYLAKGKK